MHVPWRDRRGRFLPLKAVVLAAVCIPGLVSAYWWVHGDLGARPVTEMIHNTGLWTVRFLLISLAITPFRAALDWPRLVLVRRMVGVTALVYGLLHLTLYTLDQGWSVPVVASEIVKRFYLTIGFVALLILLALGVTSTDAATRRMGRWWKRLHWLCYPGAILALLHYFIQSKANVSEPVYVAGLYVWLMLWRAMPLSWRRPVAAYPVLAVLAGLATAGIEYAWYAIATHINPWRVFAANETLAFGPRPAHLVALTGLVLALLILGRRITTLPRTTRLVSRLRLNPLRTG